MPLRLVIFAAASLAAACAGRPAAPVPPAAEMPVFQPAEPEAALTTSLTPTGPGACKFKGEADCLVDAVLAARDKLPDAKRAAVTRTLGRAVAGAKDEGFRDKWAARLDVAETAEDDAPFAEAAVRDLIKDKGWAELVRRAESAAPPFNMGRPEAMGAALPMAPDAGARAKFRDLMFDLARTKTTRGGMGDNFERGDFGHVLAEAAMKDCDVQSFDRAVALTPVPDNLRYAFWRARITGGAGNLAPRLKSDAKADDSTPVLQAIDGLAPLLALGYCKA